MNTFLVVNSLFSQWQKKKKREEMRRGCEVEPDETYLDKTQLTWLSF